MTTPSQVAFLLPGQGSQHHRMAAGLYPDDPVFTAAIEEVFAAMGKHGDALRADWLADRPEVPLDDVTRSQPLLFAVDYALAQLVLSWGVRPVALLGHSVGEMVAAVLSNIFSLADASALMLDRVARLATAPPGGMLAVAATPVQVEDLLSDGVVVGAVNAPMHTVLAGPDGPLAVVAERLVAEGFAYRRIPSHSAFHSPAVRPSLIGAEAAVAAVPRQSPTITVYSGYTAEPLGAAQAFDPAFWARQPADPVLFWPALDNLLSGDGVILLETGPGQGLANIARRHRTVRSGRSSVMALLPAKPGPREADLQSVRLAHDRLIAALTGNNDDTAIEKGRRRGHGQPQPGGGSSRAHQHP